MSDNPVPSSGPAASPVQAGLLCPVCRVDLLMTERQGIEIDYCPKCRGVWLDRGELDKIIERSETESVQPAGAAPQPVVSGQPGGFLPQPGQQPPYPGYGNPSGPWGGHDQGHGGHHGSRSRRHGFLSRLFD